MSSLAKLRKICKTSLSVRVNCRKKNALTGATHTGTIHAKIFSGKGQAELVPFSSPSTLRPGITLDTCFIEIPDVDLWVDQI